jgi:GTP1/Obg family GTP-binding protein
VPACWTPSQQDVYHLCLPSDYVRLLKYGDSLYRCKELKRAAMVRHRTEMADGGLQQQPYTL